MRRALSLTPVLVAALAGCNMLRDAGPAEQVRLAIEGRSNANPSIAARGDFVVVAWSASTPNATDVFVAVSRDAGRVFGEPTRVNDLDGDARISGEFPPRVALVPRGTAEPEVVVVWTARRADTTRLQWSRSTDAGLTFSPAAVVSGTNTKASRGWQSVAVDSAGRVLVLWLDHRDVPPMPGGHQHGAAKPSVAKHADDPTARAAFSKLYFAALSDTGGRAVTGGVCYCCKTSLAAHGSSVYGVWRHVYPGSVRDIAFTVSRDGGQSFMQPVRVSDDGWKIDGCPENGPAIAVDQGGAAHVVWSTPPDGDSDTPLKVFYAMSSDGSQFSRRVELPASGLAAHAQIAAATDGSVVVVWDEIVGPTRQVAIARSNHLGERATFERVWPGASVPGQSPVVAATRAGVVVGWVAGSGPASSITIARPK